MANTYLLAALLTGAILPVALTAAKSVGLYAFLFLAYLLAVPTSLLFVHITGKTKTLKSYIKGRKTFFIIALIGLLNYAFLEFGMAYAEGFVSASLATVVYRTSPLLMLVFLPFVLREKTTKYQAVALILAFAGLFFATTGGSLSVMQTTNVPIILFLIAVALASALATLLVKKFMYDMESSIFIFNLANLAFFSILFIASGAAIPNLSIYDIAAIIYVGVVYNVFVGFMYYGALRMLKTTFVTNIYFLSPFITFVFAHFMLGDVIQPYYVAIAVLVTAGILIQKLDKVGGSYLAKKERKLKNFVLFDVTGAFANSGEVAISSAINKGGRVLALKLDGKHSSKVDELVRAGMHADVFTDKHYAVSQESDFVKNILGASEGEMVVMKAGDTEEGEKFFEALSGALEVSEDIQPSNLSE